MLTHWIEGIKAWADKWEVTFEPTNGEAMVLSRKRCPSSPNLISDHSVVLRGKLEIFDVTFDRKLVWWEHLSNIYSFSFTGLERNSHCVQSSSAQRHLYAE